MDESTWMSCTDNRDLVGSLLAKASRRKGRLFACACYRRIWATLDGPASEGPLVRKAVEVAEGMAEGSASRQVVEDFRAAAYTLRTYEYGNGHDLVGVATRLVDEDLVSVITAAASYSLMLGHGAGCNRAEQCDLIRDILENPFRPPPPLDSQWLRWNDGTVKRLAEQAYKQRAMPAGELENARLAILADAIEEAGCHEPAVLGHLRPPDAIHVRGCWVVDLVLERKE